MSHNMANPIHRHPDILVVVGSPAVSNTSRHQESSQPLTTSRRRKVNRANSVALKDKLRVNHQRKGERVKKRAKDVVSLRESSPNYHHPVSRNVDSLLLNLNRKGQVLKQLEERHPKTSSSKRDSQERAVRSSKKRVTSRRLGNQAQKILNQGLLKKNLTKNLLKEVSGNSVLAQRKLYLGRGVDRRRNPSLRKRSHNRSLRKSSWKV